MPRQIATRATVDREGMLDFVRPRHSMVLVTTRSDGRPQASPVTGGGTWHRPADSARTVLNGMLTVLIDPAKLGTQQGFEAEARAFIAWLRQSPPGAGFDQVQIAGEPERKARAARERDGIWVDDATWAEIVAAGAKVGVSIPAD